MLRSAASSQTAYSSEVRSARRWRCASGRAMLVAVMDGEDDVGVAGIDGEQHGSGDLSRRRAPSDAPAGSRAAGCHLSASACEAAGSVAARRRMRDRCRPAPGRAPARRRGSAAKPSAGAAAAAARRWRPAGSRRSAPALAARCRIRRGRRSRGPATCGACGQVHADAEAHPGDAARGIGAGLGQDAGGLGPVQQHVVGPFQRQRGRVGQQRRQRIGQRHGGEQAPLRRRRAAVLPGRSSTDRCRLPDGPCPAAALACRARRSGAAPAPRCPSGSPASASRIDQVRGAGQRLVDRAGGSGRRSPQDRGDGRRGAPPPAAPGRGRTAAVNRPDAVITKDTAAGRARARPAGSSKNITLTMRR